MKISYVVSSGYAGLQSTSAVERRRLAALIPVWQSLGCEVVPWRRGAECDLVYVVDLPASLREAAEILRPFKRPYAVVVGVIEDVGTAQWAGLANESLDDVGALHADWHRQQSGVLGRLRYGRNALRRLGLLASRTRELLSVIATADGVVCTSELQAASLRYVNPTCAGIADCIPDRDLAVRDATVAERLLQVKASNGEILLCWEGTRWGLQLLELIREPLARVAARAAQPVRLVVVSERTRDRPLHGEIDNETLLKRRFCLPTTFLDWSLDSIGGVLQAADVGLAPMPAKHPFYRAKAFSKPLVYMAAGLPVVASAVPSYAELIRHGQDGFVVDGPVDWERALGMLVADRELRQRLGGSGARRAVEYNGVDVVAKRFASLFRDARAAWSIWRGERRSLFEC